MSKAIESTRVNPNINYRLWVIMMCQCRFIDYSKCTDLAGHADNEGVCVFVRRGCMGNSVLSAQFFCKPKTVLKEKIRFNN